MFKGVRSAAPGTQNGEDFIISSQTWLFQTLVVYNFDSEALFCALLRPGALFSLLRSFCVRPRLERPPWEEPQAYLNSQLTPMSTPQQKHT